MFKYLFTRYDDNPLESVGNGPGRKSSYHITVTLRQRTLLLRIAFAG